MSYYYESEDDNMLVSYSQIEEITCICYLEMKREGELFYLQSEEVMYLVI